MEFTCFFSYLDWCYSFGGGNHTGEKPFASCRIKDAWYQHHRHCGCSVDLDPPAEVLFVKFLHCKVTLPHPTHFLSCTVWKEVTICSPQGSLSPYLPPFIHLFNHLFVSVWNHEYLLYILHCTPVLLHFVDQTVPVLAIRSSFRWLLYLFDMSHQCRVISFLFLGHFLTFWHCKISRCILSISSCASP